jgi:hypothetical protein
VSTRLAGRKSRPERLYSSIQFDSIPGGIRIQFNSIDLYGVLEEQDYPFLTWRGTHNLKEPTA